MVGPQQFVAEIASFFPIYFHSPIELPPFRQQNQDKQAIFWHKQAHILEICF